MIDANTVYLRRHESEEVKDDLAEEKRITEVNIEKTRLLYTYKGFRELYQDMALEEDIIKATEDLIRNRNTASPEELKLLTENLFAAWHNAALDVVNKLID